MKKLVLLVACVTSMLLLNACVTHRVSPYSPAFGNLSSLNQLKKHSQPISVGDFSDQTKTKSVTCRLEGTEKLPQNMTYPQYLKQALQSELNNAGLYSAHSKIKLDAILQKLELKSMKGRWIITMTFDDHKQAPYIVSSSYDFKANLIADIACTEAAQAFVPATQKFLNTLYNNKHFQRTIKK